MLGATPQGAAVIAFSSILSKLLTEKEPAPEIDTTIRLESEIPARRIYGRVKVDGYLVYAQSQTIMQADFTPLSGAGQRTRDTKRADLLIYLSDGELDSLQGVFVNGEYHELADVGNYRVPANIVNSHYGNIQIREAFATTDVLDEITVSYAPDTTRSFILLSLLSQDQGLYRDGVPEFQFLVHGIKVKDLSDFDNASAPLVYTDNVASIYYDIVTDYADGVINEFDAYTLLRAYNYCGEKLRNNLNLIDGNGSVTSHGQVFYHSDYHLARDSKRAAANMVIQSGEGLDQVLLALETIMEGGAYIRGSKIHLYTGNTAQWINPVVLDEQDLDMGTFQITSQPSSGKLFNAIESDIAQSQAHIYGKFSLTSRNPNNVLRDGAERTQSVGTVRGVVDPFQLSRMHNHALIAQNFNVVVRGAFSGEKYVKLKPRQNVLVNVPSRQLFNQKAIVVQNGVNFLRASIVLKLSDPKEWLDYYEIPQQEDFIVTPVIPDAPGDVEIETLREFVNGATFLSALLTFTAPVEAEWVEVRLRRESNAINEWDQINRQIVTFTTDGVQRSTLTGIVDDTDYKVELYSISRSGTYSAVQEVDYNPSHDETPPDDAADVVGTTIPGGVFVSWAEVTQ